VRNDPFRRSRQWIGLPLYRAAGFTLLAPVAVDEVVA